MEAKADAVYEVSWEVCNKVGGIYTVVSSKARSMMEQYGDNFLLIGPWFPAKTPGVFEERPAPKDLKKVCGELAKEGIQIHFGKWLVKGSPPALLIDFSEYAKNANAIKGTLWDEYQLDTLGTDYNDFDEPMVFSHAAGKVIQALAEAAGKKKAVAHCHEWLCGGTVLYLKKHSQVRTVFTTHATMLGRSLASEGKNIYEEKIDAEKEARARPGVWAKYQVEKICANQANVFTTVSEITGMEAKKLLGVKPPVLLFNGLDMEKFPTFEQASEDHAKQREKIKSFLIPYFFPYYTMDLSNVLMYFIAGRPEFHTKGVDVYIQALAQLNQRMKKEGKKDPVIAFIFVPGNIKNVRPEILESKTLFDDLKDSVEGRHDKIQRRILELIISQKDISKTSLFDEDSLTELKRKTLAFLRKGKPPISTHELYDESQDPIMQACKQSGLNNAKTDPVKIIYYPIFLSGADGLLDTDYYETMQGSHLGVFPSYYEPWGYTPLEAAALGVSSVTTDLSGFGRYLCKECKQGPYPGVFVIPRLGKQDKQVTKDLSGIMYRFRKFPKHERVENKQTAKRIAATADWKVFIENYVKAHNLALQ
ncbi:MAG: glycogen/starch synthase [Candidatus Woesearchaeota archaeon]|nr:glycogen/starch synthase [Candidatus Woesearchaeota archaeon]MDP7199020.1 glycogen/starch synthase [Candidatus Woesearchaeota archaeon]MDP7467726.1 glycogen/starch synthase [Candidatus Woesearchaeota archaeon]MDP7646810.1 glycogen/starch synthase [Candidatus Woesearchaeota archaeon]